MTVTLHHGDCLEILPTLEAGSVDAIITDLPYGTTACSWDEIIPFAPMWEQVKRLLKPQSAFITTSNQPFTSRLIMSNLDWFKYEWIWRKSKASNHVNSHNRPMGKHENIIVFSNGTIANHSPNRMRYYPQGLKEVNIVNFRPSPRFGGYQGQRPSHKKMLIQNYSGYPSTMLYFQNPNNKLEHPTQKPVALYEYLVKTYTNEGDMVLDFTMGSGTTGVACVNTGRDFIGVEKELNYFEIAQKRIKQAQEARQLELIA